VPDDEKITLYYAEGPEGLQTEPESSQHALTFKLAGAINVAQVEEIPDLGMSNVSMEHVLKWDPEVIVAWDRRVQGGADKLIREEPEWADIRAVKTGRVYTMPASPFAWCDRPPGVNRLIGIQWVANLLYPQYYDVDMVDVTEEYFKNMYGIDVDRDAVEKMLGNSYTKKG
jgi:iron complex transport system substrate-binding protein